MFEMIYSRRSLSHRKDTQKDAPTKSDNYSNKHPRPKRHPEEVANGHQWPYVPAGLNEWKDLVANDVEHHERMVHARDVCADEEHAATGSQAESLVEKELGEDIPPDEVGTDAEEVAGFGFGPGCRQVIVPLLLTNPSVENAAIVAATSGSGQDLDSASLGTAGREPVLEQILHNVTDLGADEAVEGEFDNLLRIE